MVGPRARIPQTIRFAVTCPSRANARQSRLIGDRGEVLASTQPVARSGYDRLRPIRRHGDRIWILVRVPNGPLWSGWQEVRSADVERAGEGPVEFGDPAVRQQAERRGVDVALQEGEQPVAHGLAGVPEAF